MAEHSFHFKIKGIMCGVSCASIIDNTLHSTFEELQKEKAIPEFLKIIHIEYARPKGCEVAPWWFKVIVAEEEEGNIDISHIHQIWKNRLKEEIDEVSPNLSLWDEPIDNQSLTKITRNILLGTIALLVCAGIYFLPLAYITMSVVSIFSTLFCARQFIKGSGRGGDTMSRLMSLGLILSYINIGYILYSAALSITFPMAIMAFFLPIALILVANTIKYMQRKIIEQGYELLQGQESPHHVSDYYDLYGEVPDEKNTAIKGTKTHKSRIKRGVIIRIDPGSVLPVNGIIVEGSTFMDTSVINGESRQWICAESKAEVKGGAINVGNNTLYIKATSRYLDSLIADLEFRAYKENENTNNNLINQYSIYLLFGYAIILIAMTILLPYFIAHVVALGIIMSNIMGIIFSICPCAISIALSYPNVVLISALEPLFHINRVGVLSQLKDIDTFIFDKTGTLTTNESSVNHFFTENESIFLENLVPCLLALETQSEGKNHPVGKAIVSWGHVYCNYNNQPRIKQLNYQHNGISAQVNGDLIYIGNTSFMKDHGIAIPQTYLDAVNSDHNQKFTAVFIARLGVIGGVIFIEHHLRNHVPKVLSYIKKQGYRLVLLSGDRQAALDKFNTSNHFDFDAVISASEPNSKEIFVKRECQAGKKICYVGDARNDTSAMRRGISIAIAPNTPAAKYADLVLKGHILNICELKRLGKSVYSITQQNIALIVFYLSLLASFIISASVLGLAMPPILMVILMLSSTISVYFNSQRIQFITDYLYRDKNMLTYFVISPQFLVTIIVGALLIFGSLQAQLIMMGHISIISFAATSTTIMSACFIGGISIVGICLAFLLCKYVSQYLCHSSRKEELSNHINDERSCFLINLCRKFSIFKKNDNSRPRLLSKKNETNLSIVVGADEIINESSRINIIQQ